MVEWKCSLMLFPDAVKEAAEVTIAHKRAAFESAWWHRTCLSKRVEGRRYVIGASQLEMAPFFFFLGRLSDSWHKIGLAPGTFLYD